MTVMPYLAVSWVVGMVVMYSAAGVVRGPAELRSTVDAIEEALAIVLWPVVLPMALVLVFFNEVRGE